jgi:hypothetical protein
MKRRAKNLKEKKKLMFGFYLKLNKKERKKKLSLSLRSPDIVFIKTKKKVLLVSCTRYRERKGYCIFHFFFRFFDGFDAIFFFDFYHIFSQFFLHLFFRCFSKTVLKNFEVFCTSTKQYENGPSTRIEYGEYKLRASNMRRE